MLNCTNQVFLVVCIKNDDDDENEDDNSNLVFLSLRTDISLCYTQRKWYKFRVSHSLV